MAITPTSLACTNALVRTYFVDSSVHVQRHMCADKSVIQDALTSIMKDAERYLCLPRDSTVLDPYSSHARFQLGRVDIVLPLSARRPIGTIMVQHQRKTMHVLTSNTHI